MSFARLCNMPHDALAHFLPVPWLITIILSTRDRGNLESILIGQQRNVGLDVTELTDQCFNRALQDLFFIQTFCDLPAHLFQQA